MHQQQPFYPDEEWNPYEEEYDDFYVESYELPYEDDVFYYPAEDDYPPEPMPNMGVLIAIAIFLFFAFVILKNGSTTTLPDSLTLAEGIVSNALAAPTTPTPTGDPLAFTAPYTDYTLTQGLHGQSYGHLAIDLAAGRGTPVLSPINGLVTGNYTDQYGNTTLIIENDVYRVLILHGDFFAQVGEPVQLGQQVGTESNHGYTTDMAGNRCYGREWCGNHTHLNVFDKRTGTNTNPLDLINP